MPDGTGMGDVDRGMHDLPAPCAQRLPDPRLGPPRREQLRPRHDPVLLMDQHVQSFVGKLPFPPPVHPSSLTDLRPPRQKPCG